MTDLTIQSRMNLLKLASSLDMRDSLDVPATPQPKPVPRAPKTAQKPKPPVPPKPPMPDPDDAIKIAKLACQDLRVAMAVLNRYPALRTQPGWCKLAARIEFVKQAGWLNTMRGGARLLGKTVGRTLGRGGAGAAAQRTSKIRLPRASGAGEMLTGRLPENVIDPLPAADRIAQVVGERKPFTYHSLPPEVSQGRLQNAMSRMAGGNARAGKMPSNAYLSSAEAPARLRLNPRTGQVEGLVEKTPEQLAAEGFPVGARPAPASIAQQGQSATIPIQPGANSTIRISPEQMDDIYSTHRALGQPAPSPRTPRQPTQVSTQEAGDMLRQSMGAGGAASAAGAAEGAAVGGGVPRPAGGANNVFGRSPAPAEAVAGGPPPAPGSAESLLNPDGLPKPPGLASRVGDSVSDMWNKAMGRYKELPGWVRKAIPATGAVGAGVGGYNYAGRKINDYVDRKSQEAEQRILGKYQPMIEQAQKLMDNPILQGMGSIGQFIQWLMSLFGMGAGAPQSAPVRAG